MRSNAMARPESPVEEEMAQYTELHLTRLLKPVADHLLELQDAIREVFERVNRTDSHVYTHETRLDDVGNWMVQMKGNLAATKAHLVAMQNNLAQTNAEKADLENDHTNLKKCVRILEQLREEEAQKATASRELLGTTAGSLEQLQTEFRETRLHVNDCLEPNIRQALQEITELASKHYPLEEKVDMVRGHSDEVERSFKEFMKKQQRDQEDDQATFQSFNTQLQNVKAKVKELESVQEKVQHELHEDTSEVKQLWKLITTLDADSKA